MGLFDAFKGMMGGTKSEPIDDNNSPNGGKIEPPAGSSPQDSMSGPDTNPDAGGPTSVSPLGSTGMDSDQPSNDTTTEPETPSATSFPNPEAETPPAPMDTPLANDPMGTGNAETANEEDESSNQPATPQFSDNQKLDSTDGLNSAPSSFSAPTVSKEDEPTTEPTTDDEPDKSDDQDVQLPHGGPGNNPA